MSANSVARQIATRAPISLFRITRREISTRSLPPIIATSTPIEFGVLNNLASMKAPVSGWKKTIVSSASSIPAYDSSSASLEDVSMEKLALDTTAKEDGFKLDVDMEELHKLAAMRCTPLSLRNMYKYAVDFNNQEQRLLNAQFLHKELPIRIAQRAVDLLTLPHGLNEVLPVRQIAHVYLLYLEKFQEFPFPTTPEEETNFTEVLGTVIMDRTSIPNAIAQGVDAWLENEDLEGARLPEMEDALYRFFTARVGLRFLIEHHILSSPSRVEDSVLRKSQSTITEDEQPFLGCIKKDCCPADEILKVADMVTLQTKDHYGVCPEIQIVESIHSRKSKFTYVPHHLHYMAGELLRNSCRSTVRK
jgi:pyruvate dehydrogenase kinase 2/3/4